MKDISFLFVNYIVLNILQLEAEDVPEISEKYEITAVPTFIFIKVREKWPTSNQHCEL